MLPDSLSSIPFWSRSAEETISLLETSPDGLPPSEVDTRLDTFGPNAISEAKKVSAWIIWWRQFRSLIVGLLLVAAGISLVIGDYAECLAVLTVVVANSLIGFFTELKATRSMAALRKMSQMTARVNRGGEPRRIDSNELVPGDWVILEAGDMVPADIRITEANSLQSDESALTGESLPIRKSLSPMNEATPLAERKSMLYRGAKITGGTGAGVIVGTGGESELGKISSLVAKAEHHSTPLEKQLDRLGYRLVWVTLALMLLMTLAGIIKGIDILTMVQTSIALAIAAIPEGLPIVATIALAHGLWKMAKRNAIINQLSAVETLGSTRIICTDKTGTLTENKMTVSAVWPAGSTEWISPDDSAELTDPVRRMMVISALCNNAEVTEKEAVGDPLEIALLEWIRDSNLDPGCIKTDYPRTSEIPFDAAKRKMISIHEDGSQNLVAVKGAAEALLPFCAFDAVPETKDEWENRNLNMARRGLRVIAIAEKRTEPDEIDTETRLTFLGLIGLIDPPRSDISKAIGECQSAGIRVVMITGDQAPTAIAIAEQIGIEKGTALTGAELSSIDFHSPKGKNILNKVSIIARSTPAQKLSLVEYFQGQNHVVAMTGDGVNDAPALKQADIGIAMGRRGTDVAREAAAMVLQDDSFKSIVVAIRQGRVILANIKKFVVYLMSCNLSEILVVWICMMFTNQLPLLPLQILFLNLVTDVFPALALGVTPGNPEVMKQRPRKAGDRILNSSDWGRIAWYGFVISLATLGAFLFALFRLGNSPEEAVTVSFLTLALAQLVHVFNMSDRPGFFLSSEVAKNPWVWRALGLCLVLLIAAAYLPVLSEVLSLRPPGMVDLLTIFGFASIPLLVETVRRSLQSMTKGSHRKDQ